MVELENNYGEGQPNLYTDKKEKWNIKKKWI